MKAARLLVVLGAAGGLYYVLTDGGKKPLIQPQSLGAGTSAAEVWASWGPRKAPGKAFARIFVRVPHPDQQLRRVSSMYDDGVYYAGSDLDFFYEIDGPVLPASFETRAYEPDTRMPQTYRFPASFTDGSRPGSAAWVKQQNRLRQQGKLPPLLPVGLPKDMTGVTRTKDGAYRVPNGDGTYRLVWMM